MQQLRTDIWVAAFIRRLNNTGRFCVVSRRGDAIAGQVWIEIDHLDGTATLLTPFSSAALQDTDRDRVFQRRFDRAAPAEIRERIMREGDFDPDLWVISVDSRDDELDLDVV